MHKQKFKEPQGSTCQISRLIRGSGSILTGGNILSLDFFGFHVVLPMLCVCENPELG